MLWSQGRESNPRELSLPVYKTGPIDHYGTLALQCHRVTVLLRSNQPQHEETYSARSYELR